MKTTKTKKLASLLLGTLLSTTIFANQSTNWLFLQHAKEATVFAKGQSCYQLNLRGINPKIIYFADQPNDEVGRIDLAKFLQLWQEDKYSLHNAALHAQSTNGTIIRILTLKDPKWHAASKKLTYQACVTDPKTEDRKIPNELSNVVLFIDPINGSLWG